MSTNDEMTLGITHANRMLVAHLMHHLVEADAIPRDWIMHLLQAVEVQFNGAATAAINKSAHTAAIVATESAKSIIETRNQFRKLNPDPVR
jgi:hypothetical protein